MAFQHEAEWNKRGKGWALEGALLRAETALEVVASGEEESGSPQPRRNRRHVQKLKTASANQMTQLRTDHCPICRDQPREPWRLSCGHRYCTTCIREWFARCSASLCPLCGASPFQEKDSLRRETLSFLCALVKVSPRSRLVVRAVDPAWFSANADSNGWSLYPRLRQAAAGDVNAFEKLITDGFVELVKTGRLELLESEPPTYQWA